MTRLTRRLAVLTTAAALALSGCAADPVPETDPAQVQGEIVPRKISWLLSRPADGAVIQIVEEIAQDYAQEHPGFELELITTPDRPSYLQKLITLATAGELPEFFDTDATPYAQKLREQGRLVDVEALLDEMGRLDEFRPLALDYQRFDDGGLYLLPFELDLELFFYNRSAFAEAGLEPPKTLQDMVAMCDPLRETGAVPIALDGVDQWPLQRYLSYYPFRETGNEFLGDLASGQASMTQGPGADASTWIDNLATEDCFADGFSAATYTDALDLFTTGRAGVYNVGTWELGSLTGPDLPEAMRDNIGFFTLPTTPDARTDANEYVVGSGIGMAINAETFDPLVKDFVDYLLERYPQRYADQGRFAPTLGTVTAVPDGASPLYGEVAALLEDLGEETARPWDTRLDPASNTRLQQELTLLAQGEITPEEFATTIDAVIAQNAGR